MLIIRKRIFLLFFIKKKQTEKTETFLSFLTSLLPCSMNGKFVKCMKIQLKVQNLCPPSQFPKLSSAVGPDWSLLSADYSRGPYVWHPWFREFNEHIYQIWQQGCQTQAKLESLNPLFTVSQTLVGDTQVTWPLLIEALAYFAPVWTLDCCCLDWNKPDDTSKSQNL